MSLPVPVPNFTNAFAAAAGLGLTLLCFALSAPTVLAQADDYHAGLLSDLMADHNLPAGDWLFFDSEAENLTHAYRYGAQVSSAPISDQAFRSVVSVRTDRAYPNHWDAGYGMANVARLAQGDVVLVVFSARSAGGAGRLAVTVERSSDYAKEFFIQLPVDINWQTFYIAFETTQGPHASGSLNLVFQTGHQAQDIRLGGVTGINFGDAVALSDVPSDLNASDYDGSTADAPWRAPAAARIDELRKADLRIEAVTSAGAPVPGAAVRVEQERHEFAFGTAIKACRIAGNSCADVTFVDKLLDLDGRGHGFNWVVFENDLKWPAWENRWFESNENVARATQWLRERDIEVRGHNLLWPGFDNLPADVNARASDTAYVLRRIREHIRELGDYPGIAGELADWDVINETVTNTTLANGFRGQPGYATGRELYAEVFRIADEAFPEAALYLNDYVTLSTQSRPGDNAYEAYKRNVGELMAAGAPIDGVGFQGHIRGRPNGIPSVLATFDDFYDAYGLEAKVTEYDLPTTVSDELGAQYTTDFLRATFSHPSMTGITFWNWWDIDTWQNPQANFYTADWEETPAGAAYVDLVFDEWWTNEAAVADAGGVATVRAFKGVQVVKYNCGGEVRTDTVTLGEDMTHRIVCDDLATGLTESAEGPAFRLSPNPTTGTVRVEHAYGAGVEVEVYSALGQRVYAGILAGGGGVLPLELAAGSYAVQLVRDGRRSVELLVVE